MAAETKTQELEARLQAAEAELERYRGNGGAASVPNLARMLRSGTTSYGTLIQSPSPFWVAWAGKMIAKEVGVPCSFIGFHPRCSTTGLTSKNLEFQVDFVFIDTEHTPIPRDAVSAMCMMYKGVGLPALVRVVDAEEARQALDGGAAGVVLPYVETVEQVWY